MLKLFGDRYARTRMHVSDCILIILISFAIGSIPFGVLLAKAFGLADPRTIGSGNIGATNMLRTGRKDIAALTLVLDALKGVVPILLAWQFFSVDESHTYGCFNPSGGGCGPVWVLDSKLAALAMLSALIGHCYTPWLKGKGGKGVATALGGAFALSWPVGIAFCCSWLLAFLFTRWVSVASIVGLAVIPLVTWLRLDGTTALITAIAAAIGIWRHRENIKRLRAGTEPKMMGKKHA